MELVNALSPPRGEACPSDLVLAEFDAEVLPAERRTRVAEHVAACARCRDFLDEGRRAFEAIDGTRKDAIVSAMVEASARKRSGRRALGPLLAAAAAVMAALIFVPKTERGDTTSKGGGLALGVYREREGQVARTLSGDSFFPGDRLRFSVDLPEPAHVMIVGVERSGALYPCFPPSRGAALSRPAGSGQLLEDAIVLDASSGREALHLIACPEPFTFADIERRGPESLAREARCRRTEFELEKSRP